MVFGYSTGHLKGGLVGPPYTLGGHGLSGKEDASWRGGTSGMQMQMSQYASSAPDMEELNFGGVDTYYSDSPEYGLQQAAYRATMKYTDAKAAAATTVHEGLIDGKTMEPVPLEDQGQQREATAGSRSVDEMMATLGMGPAQQRQSTHQMRCMTVEDAWAVVDTNGRTPSTFPEPGEIPGAELLCMSGVKACINNRPGKRTDTIRQQVEDRNTTIPRPKPNTDDFRIGTGTGNGKHSTGAQHFIAPVLPAEAAAEAAAIAYYQATGYPSPPSRSHRDEEAMGAHGTSLIHSTGLPHTSWPIKQAGQPHPTLSNSVVLAPRRRTAVAPRGRTTPFGSTVSRFRNKVPKGCTNAPAVIETRGRPGLESPAPGHCHPNMNADRSLSRNAFDGGARRGVSNNANVNYNIRTRPNVVVRSEATPIQKRSGHFNAPKPRSHYRETGRPPRRTVSSTRSHVKSTIFY